MRRDNQNALVVEECDDCVIMKNVFAFCLGDGCSSLEIGPSM